MVLQVSESQRRYRGSCSRNDSLAMNSFGDNKETSGFAGDTFTLRRLVDTSFSLSLSLLLGESSVGGIRLCCLFLQFCNDLCRRSTWQVERYFQFKFYLYDTIFFMTAYAIIC